MTRFRVFVIQSRRDHVGFKNYRNVVKEDDKTLGTRGDADEGKCLLSSPRPGLML